MKKNQFTAIKTLLISGAILALGIFGYVSAYIEFGFPTPDNNTYTTNSNIYTRLMITGDLQSLSWNRNGTIYNIYNNTLLMYYDFNTHANGMNDKSLWGNNLTGNTNLIDEGGSDCIIFDDTQYITGNTNLSISDEVTISTKIRKYTTTNSFTIFKKTDDNNNGIIINSTGNTLYANIRNGENNILSGYIGDQTRYTITITYKKGDKIKLFIDGTKIDEKSINNYPITSNTGYITMGPGYFGKLDDFKLYNRTFSENEVLFSFKSSLDKVPFVNSDWNFTTNNIGLIDGIYTYTGTATFSGGSTESTGRTLIIDNNNPTIYLTTPTSGTSISAQYFTLSRAGFDYPAGISGYKYSISNTGNTELLSGFTQNGSITITGLNNGTYVWNITAYDKLNHSTVSESRTIIYQKPIIGSAYFSGLKNNIYTNKTGVSLVLTANKAVNYLITGNIISQINGSIPNNTSVINIPITLLTGNGSKTVTIIYSNSGDTNVTLQPSVYLDQTSPTVTLFNPVHLSTYNTGTITFSWSASDNTSIQEFRFYLDNLVTPKTILSGNITTYTVNNIADASHAWKVEAVDIAGNISGSQTFIFTTDSSTPTISGVTNNTYYSTSVTPTISGATQTWLNGITYVPGTTITGDGNYTLIAKNIAGNQTQVTFVIDTTKPTITLAGPANSASFTNSNNITFSRNGTDSNLSGYILIVNGLSSTGVNLPASINSYTINNLANGTYSRYVTAIDKAGNSANPASVNGFTLNVQLTGSIVLGGVTGSSILYSSGSISIQSTMNKTCTLDISGNTLSFTTITRSLSAGVSQTEYITLYPAGDGSKTINLSYSNGIETSLTRAYTIYVDQSGPTQPTFTTTSTTNTGAFTLGWTSSTDGGVGLKDYAYTISNGSSIVKSGYTTATSISINNMEIGGNGTYTATIQARDLFNNGSTISSHSFTYVGIPDTIPDSFSFDRRYDAELETIYKSDSITITGLSENTTVEAYVDNGDLYINGTNVGTTGTVQNGSVVKVALESSDEYDTTTLAVLIIGQQSATFKVTTISEDDGDDNNNDSDEDSDDDIGDIISISSSQKIQISALYNVLSDLYTSSKKDEFMTTLKAMIKERIQEMQDDDEDESKIGALQYLYQLIDDDYSEDSSTYTAPNGKKYTITYSSSQGYTSPNFINKNKYFSTLSEIKYYIDINNKSSSSSSSSSSSTTTNYNVDQSRTSSPYTAPNGKVYRLLKTTDGLYSSYDFMYAKTFSTLAAMKDYIYKNNKK